MIDSFKLFRINIIGLHGRKSATEPGYPDLTGYIKSNESVNAVPVMVEVKAPGKDCKNEKQLEILNEAFTSGCLAFWCNSLKDFIEKISKWIY